MRFLLSAYFSFFSFFIFTALVFLACRLDALEHGPKYRCVISSSMGQEVIVMAADGTIEQRVKVRNAHDAWMLPDGTVVYCGHFAVGTFGKDGMRVDLASFPGKQRGEIFACQPLPDGGVMFVCCRQDKLIELDKHGQQTLALPLNSKSKRPHFRYRKCRKLPNGHYLLTRIHEGRVDEIDSQGRLVKTICKVGGPHSAVRLQNGNTLVSSMHGKKVVEFDDQQKEVWKFSQKNANPYNVLIGSPSGIQRLSNGNTIIIMKSRAKDQVPFSHDVLEVTPDKKIIWAWKPEGIKGFSAIHVLEDNKDPVKHEVYR